MKTLLPAFALGLLAGLALGRLAAAPAPPARPPAPPAVARPEAAAVETPPAEPAPPRPPAAAPAPALPAAWAERLWGTGRVAELLSFAVPEGDAATLKASHAALRHRTRQRLKDPDAQAAFLAEFPALSREQLVVLWDVLWMGDVQQRLSTFGAGFAAEFSRTLTDLYTTRTDARDKELLCNLLLPDMGFVSDDRLERLRSLLAADAHPHLRDKARQLPVRVPR